MSDTRCRVCLCLEEYSISLGAPTIIEEGSLSFSEILESCCNIKISQDDGKPQNICIKCAYTARTIYDFKKLCWSSDVYVQNELENICNNNQMVDNIKKECISDQQYCVQGTNENSENEYLRDYYSPQTTMQSVEKECIRPTNIRNYPEVSSADSTTNISLHYETNSLFDDTACNNSANNISYGEPNPQDIFGGSRMTSNYNGHITRNYESNPSDYNYNAFIIDEINIGSETEDSDRFARYSMADNLNHKICKFCDFVASCTSELNNHLALSHKEHTYPFCLFCNDIFDMEKDLAEHVTKYHSGMKQPKRVRYDYLTCVYCGNSFTTIANLYCHSKTYHKMTKKYKCNAIHFNKARDPIKCNKSFASKEGHLQHKRQHKRNCEAICYLCDTIYNSNIELRQHLKRRHLDRMCDLCRKCYISSYSLNEHIGAKHAYYKDR